MNSRAPEMDEVPAWRRYHLWTRERFPIPGVAVYAGAQYALVYAFAGRLPGATSLSPADVVLGWIIVFLTFFRLRVTDEEKDFSRDVKVYPERLLSRGVVNLRGLYALFFMALAVEFGLCLFLGRRVLGVWLLINLWFFLMYVEFFASDFLNAHIGWYLVSHQLLVPLLALLPLAQRCDLAVVAAGRGPIVLALLAALLCGTMTYEIARKTWSPDREKPDAVSYSRDWGMGASAFVNQFLAAAATVLLSALLLRHGSPPAYPAAIAAAYVAFLVVELLFLRRPDRGGSKRVEGFGMLFMLTAFVTATVALARGAAG